MRQQFHHVLIVLILNSLAIISKYPVDFQFCLIYSYSYIISYMQSSYTVS